MNACRLGVSIPGAILSGKAKFRVADKWVEIRLHHCAGPLVEFMGRLVISIETFQETT